jgi:hypothetical protein
LTFFASIVASIREHPDFEQWDWLQFFVRRGKAIMLEKGTATLFNHILERDKAGLILFQTLLQGGNRSFDRRTILARWSLLGFGSNEAYGFTKDI